MDTDSTVVRAALYARVSTNGHGQDTGLQLDELRQVAAQRGWLATEYVDEGISGAKASRPALDDMMAAARKGDVDIVLVWRFDRFARSTRHLLQALEEFRQLDVEFISLRENIDTSTPMGRAVFTIVAAVAELERELISERVRAGVQRARRQGKQFGRPRRQLDLRAARLLLGQGHSVREVADLLGFPRTTLRRRLKEHETACTPCTHGDQLQRDRPEEASRVGVPTAGLQS